MAPNRFGSAQWPHEPGFRCLGDTMCCFLTAFCILFGIYSMVAYTTAFSLELWWIIDASGDLPVAAYVLVTGYFVVFLTSVFLVVGIILNKQIYLRIWIFITVLFFFPECGLVLFMTLYHWTLARKNGMVELCFYIGRAVLNVFAIVCIQKLYSARKEERAVMKRLETMNINGSMLSESGPLHKDGKPPPCYLGHVNAAFTYGSPAHLPIKVTRGPSSASSLHRYQETRPGPRIVSTPRIYWSGERCEFDAATFADHIACRPHAPRGNFRSCQSDLQTATMSFDGGGWGYGLETQSLERSKHLRTNGMGRRSRSLEQVAAAPDPHFYEDPDSEHSIRDIAL